MVNVSGLGSKITRNGTYSLALVSDTVYGRELLNSVTFTVNRTLEVNAMQVESSLMTARHDPGANPIFMFGPGFTEESHTYQVMPASAAMWANSAAFPAPSFCMARPRWTFTVISAMSS